MLMRKQLASTFFATFFAALVAACGTSGPDGTAYLGSYQISSHRENHQQGDAVACDDPGPPIVVGDPAYAPYFALVADDFGDSIVAFQTCAGPGTDCVDTLLSFEVGDSQLISSGANSQTGGGTSCNLYANHAFVTLDGDVATLESRQWSSFDQPADDCTLEAAEALVGTALCQDVEVWVGTRN